MVGMATAMGMRSTARIHFWSVPSSLPTKALAFTEATMSCIVAYSLMSRHSGHAPTAMLKAAAQSCCRHWTRDGMARVSSTAIVLVGLDSG